VYGNSPNEKALQLLHLALASPEYGAIR